jgi:hypothetical protein
MQDVNGANIVGPIDGYALYVANLLGGYANRQNPQDSPLYSIATRTSRRSASASRSRSVGRTGSARSPTRTRPPTTSCR